MGFDITVYKSTETFKPNLYIWNKLRTAIHIDTNGEIVTLPEKETPIGSDVIIIEDSEDSYSKKKVQFSLIGVGGGSEPEEGPGIDLDGLKIGLGGDSVLVYHTDGNPVSEFSTIAEACAVAVSGNKIVIDKPGTYYESFTLPTNVLLEGNEQVTICGEIQLSDRSTLKALRIYNSDNKDTPVFCVRHSTAGTSWIKYCSIESVNTGNGDAYGIWANDDVGLINIWECEVNAISTSGSGYAGYLSGGAKSMMMDGGSAFGSTAPFNL